MRTAADAAQTVLKPARRSTIVLNASLPRRATMNRHGCVLPAEGDQRAASSAERSVRSSIPMLGSNARGLQRSARAGSRGADVSALRRVDSARDMGLLQGE